MPTQKTTRSNSNTTTNSDDTTVNPQQMSLNIASLVSEQINKLLQPLVNQIQQLLNDYKKLSDEMDQLRQEHMQAKEKLTESILEEVRQREMRRDYIIISGVPEQQGDTAGDRKDADASVIKEIADELECSLSFSVAYRIGKPVSGRPRLLRVKCVDADERASLLRNARKLRDTDVPHLKSVYINPDRTLLERERRKKMMEEVKSRRLAGERVTIRHGKIVAQDDPNTVQNFH